MCQIIYNENGCSFYRCYEIYKCLMEFVFCIGTFFTDYNKIIKNIQKRIYKKIVLNDKHFVFIQILIIFFSNHRHHN